MKLIRESVMRYSILFTINFFLVHIFGTIPWLSHFSEVTISSAGLLSSIKPDVYDGDNLQIVRKNKVESFSAVNEEVARDFFSKVRVLCWVMTAPKNHWRKARHVKRTWGKRCNTLLFVSSKEDDRIPTVKVPSIEGYNTLWTKTREAFRYVWENYRDHDWFLKADDDSFIVLENLRYHLSAYNTSEPFYFGHKYKAYLKSGYMQGGSGYVLSKEALRRFIETGLVQGRKCASDDTEWAEDVKIGECMQELDCKGIDTRDAYGRDRYLPLTLESHVSLGVADDTWFFDVHPSYYHINKEGFNCCSDTAIGFHQVTPKQMYLYEYLIYELRVYGVENIRTELQSKPDAPPDADLTATPFSGLTPEEEKWSESLKMREESQRKERLMMEEKAQMLDSNETARVQAWQRGNQ